MKRSRSNRIEIRSDIIERQISRLLTFQYYFSKIVVWLYGAYNFLKEPILAHCVTLPYILSTYYGIGKTE